MIISFAATVVPLLLGRKTQTRRLWKDSHAAHFKPEDFVTAYDRSPRNGGKPMMNIRIRSVEWEFPMAEYDDVAEEEGLAWMERAQMRCGKLAPRAYYEELREASWQRGGVYVVRFAPCGYFPAALERYPQLPLRELYRLSMQTGGVVSKEKAAEIASTSRLPHPGLLPPE